MGQSLSRSPQAYISGQLLLCLWKWHKDRNSKLLTMLGQ